MAWMLRSALAFCAIALSLACGTTVAQPSSTRIASAAPSYSDCSRRLDDLGCYVFSAQSHRKAALGITLARKYAPPRSDAERALPEKTVSSARADMVKRYEALSARLSGNPAALAALKDAAAFWTISMQFVGQEPGESWDAYSQRQAGIDAQLHTRLERLPRE